MSTTQSICSKYTLSSQVLLSDSYFFYTWTRKLKSESNKQGERGAVGGGRLGGGGGVKKGRRV